MSLATPTCGTASRRNGFPGLEPIASLAAFDLPVIWDIDFLYGPKTEESDDHTSSAR